LRRRVGPQEYDEGRAASRLPRSESRSASSVDRARTRARWLARRVAACSGDECGRRARCGRWCAAGRGLAVDVGAIGVGLATGDGVLLATALAVAVGASGVGLGAAVCCSAAVTPSLSAHDCRGRGMAVRVGVLARASSSPPQPASTAQRTNAPQRAERSRSECSRMCFSSYGGLECERFAPRRSACCAAVRIR